jgi:tRNA-dihydrouridine synthase A
LKTKKIVQSVQTVDWKDSVKKAKENNKLERRFSIAPMMDWTDRHCRFFHRILTKRALLYTEMITADAIIHGDRERLLGFSPEERPLALQLGGSDPAKLEMAAVAGAAFGYDEINLNAGCPSDRVQEGRFGACLMREPELVAASVERMRKAVDIPVTVKCRIGVDDQDSEADLDRFVASVAEAGCTVFIIHARKAWLKGLSPKENREVPPLDYGRVFRLKRKHPHLIIVLNGGVASLDEAERHLAEVDGVMLGRAAYHTPYVLAEVDRRLFGDEKEPITRREVLGQLIPYVERHLAAGGRLGSVTRHILGLYHGCQGARTYRRLLGEGAAGDVKDLKPLLDAIQAVENPAAPGSVRQAA